MAHNGSLSNTSAMGTLQWPGEAEQDRGQRNSIKWLLENLDDNGSRTGDLLGLLSSNSEMSGFHMLVDNLKTYVLPVLIFVGLAGNAVSFTVFMCTHLKQTSCNVYLSALAMSDSAFLVCVLFSWADDIYNRNGWCQALVYLTHVTSFLSVWYVAAFTVERFVLVCMPGYRPLVCRAKTAKDVVLVLACFAMIVYLFSPLMSGVIEPQDGHSLCALLPEFTAAYWVITIIDTFITLIIPTIIILGCNIRIAYLVCMFYHAKGQSTVNQVWKWDFTSDHAGRQAIALVPTGGDPVGGATYTSAGSKCVQTVHVRRKGNYQMRATQMLLIVSTVFLLCNLPLHVVRAYAFIHSAIHTDSALSPTFFAWQKFSQLIHYANFSVNVFLYSFSSRTFRLGFRRLLTKVNSRFRNLVKKTRPHPSSVDQHVSSSFRHSRFKHDRSL